MVKVAPRAGVWIETCPFRLLCCSYTVAPRAGVWIETLLRIQISCFPFVAPRAGVWIETPQCYYKKVCNILSRPVRACGLKLTTLCKIIRGKMVAPRAGVWIETVLVNFTLFPFSVAPRAGVWIETVIKNYSQATKKSRPVRACGLKHHLLLLCCHHPNRRAPCGRVD